MVNVSIVYNCEVVLLVSSVWVWEKNLIFI